MKSKSKLNRYWLLSLCLILITSCAETGRLNVQDLCPVGPGVSWVVVAPETLEFFPINFELGNVDQFRLLIVASDGKSPDDYTSCASALAYPPTQNLPLNAEYRQGEVLTDIAEQTLVVDANAVGERPLYLYFIGVNADRDSQAVNEALSPSVYAIRQAIHEVLRSGDTEHFDWRITKFLIDNYTEFIKEEQIVAYGAFKINPDNWRTGARHRVFSNEEIMHWRYELRQFDGLLLPENRYPAEQENVIINGDFEDWWRGNIDGVAPHWDAYSNGVGHTALYKEEWEEAVFRGLQSQLMEIGLFSPGERDAVIAIHQTFEVVPNSTYDLSFFAQMRSDAPFELFNTDEYALDWGVDYTGQGNYDAVVDWFPANLTEQPRLGSNNPIPGTFANYEESKLDFERVTGLVTTGSRQFISLFIRGVKRNATGIEVNFNVDDVVLFGPSPFFRRAPAPPTPVPPPDAAQTPVASQPALPGVEPTPVPFTLPTPEPEVPVEVDNFLYYLRNNYNTINGLPLFMQGIYIQNGSTAATRRVIIDYSPQGAETYRVQPAESRQNYLNRLLDDVVTFFGEQDSSVLLLDGEVGISNPTAASCVTLVGGNQGEVIACRTIERVAVDLSITGDEFGNAQLENGVRIVQ